MKTQRHRRSRRGRQQIWAQMARIDAETRTQRHRRRGRQQIWAQMARIDAEARTQRHRRRRRGRQQIWAQMAQIDAETGRRDTDAEAASRFGHRWRGLTQRHGRETYGHRDTDAGAQTNKAGAQTQRHKRKRTDTETRTQRHGRRHTNAGAESCQQIWARKAQIDGDAAHRSRLTCFAPPARYCQDSIAAVLIGHISGSTIVNVTSTDCFRRAKAWGLI